MSTLSPDYVRRISPYVPGKPIAELAREYGLVESRIVKLASNENPRGPSPKVRAAIAAAAADVTRYPDGNGFALKQALAARFGVGLDQIVLGNGSNDILELATQAFLRPGDDTVYAQHAFAVYPLATQARGARGIEVPSARPGSRSRGNARRADAANAHRVYRQSEQSDRDLAVPGRRAGVRRLRSGQRADRAGRGVQRISAGRPAGEQRLLDRGASEPAGVAHFFQGLWTCRPARRLWHRRC